jgi:cyclophilin family peptidyl-prolyl cis-trans isomerase
VQTRFGGLPLAKISGSVLAAFLVLFPAKSGFAADTTYVRFNTIFGPIDVQMLSDEAPNTVTNFLGYVNKKAYNSSIIHRAETSPASFFQGGSYKDNVSLSVIATGPAINNEFSVSNTAGTLAMGLVGSNINSATSGWFFNTADNSALFDPGKYTVFGRIANAASTAVSNNLQAVPVPNPPVFNSPFDMIPLVNYSGGTVHLDNLVAVNSVVTEPLPTAATLTLGGLAANFTNTPKSVTVTTTPTRLATVVTYNGSLIPPTSTGTYTAVAVINSSGFQGSTTGTLVIGNAITKLKGSVKLGSLAAVYNASPHAATATTSPVSGLTVDFTYNGSATAPTAVGTYTVVGTINDPNFAGSATGNLVISKGTATVALSNLAATFDGSPHAATATTTPPGLTVALTYNGSSTAPTAAGIYAVAATVNDPSYVGTSTGTLVIANATITLGNLAYTYNGSARPATATTTPSGLPVTLTYNGKTAVPVNAGSYAVLATINSSGNAATATGTLVISPAAATVTVSNVTVAYTGKPVVATAVTAPPKLPVSFTYNGSGTAPTPTGTYTVVGTETNPNYTGSGTGTVTITPVPPVAITGPATSITSSGATLGGTINPMGSATTVTFQYGTTTAYTGTTSGVTAGNGGTNLKGNVPVTGLTYATLYHYRIAATTSTSTITGADATFTTLGPGIAPSPATPLLSASGAQVGFGINPNGVATSVYFKYSTDQTFATFSQSATQSIGSGRTSVLVNGFLGRLQPTTTYYYEVVVTSSAGTFTGPVESFTTLAFDTSLVAKSGDSASVTGGNGTYDLFGDVAINSGDEVAFAASLNLSATSPVITSANDLGIWANQGSSALALVAQTGGTAPDTNLSGSSATFNSVGDPLFNENNDVAFGGQLNVVTGQATNANSLGVWSTSTGALHLVAREGDPAPGYQGSTLTAFSSFNALALTSDNANDAIIVANIANGSGVNSSNNLGIWEGTLKSNLVLKMRTGDVIGARTIANLDLASSQPLLQGQTRNFASTTGDLAALVVFTDHTTGIVTSLGGTEAVAESVNSPVPDSNGTTMVGATFAAFNSPIINDSDHLAFEATLVTGGAITSATKSGIWADNGSGTLELVAQTGQVGTAFLTLSDPLDNNNDAVAFSATYKSGSTTLTGLYCNSTGTLTRVAETGQQAPACPTGVMFNSFSVMALADAGGATNKGGLVFEGTITGTGVTSATNTGIWAVDGAGMLQLIVRTGDSLNLGTSGTPVFKTIKEIAFLPYSGVLDGQTRSVAKNEDLAYTVTFTDNSTAIFEVVF